MLGHQAVLNYSAFLICLQARMKSKMRRRLRWSPAIPLFMVKLGGFYRATLAVLCLLVYPIQNACPSNRVRQSLCPLTFIKNR